MADLPGDGADLARDGFAGQDERADGLFGLRFRHADERLAEEDP